MITRIVKIPTKPSKRESRGRKASLFVKILGKQRNWVEALRSGKLPLSSSHCSSLFNTERFMENGRSQNPRMVWFGKDLKAHLIPHPAMGRDSFHHPRVLRATSSLALDTPSSGESWQGVRALRSWGACRPLEP